MDLRHRIEQEEDQFPQGFSNQVTKDYGVLFFQEQNKASYDSNHAVIYEDRIVDLAHTLREITTFYEAKGIQPNIYQSAGDFGYFDRARPIFQACGYQVLASESVDIMVLQEENRIPTTNRLDIRIVTEWDPRIADDICVPANEEHEIEVIKAGVKADAETVFVAYQNERAVAVTYLHVSTFDVCRFDYILVAPTHRNKGYARELLSHVVDYARQQHLPTCYTWPAHAASRRILAEAGFVSFFQMEIGRAFRKE